MNQSSRKMMKRWWKYTWHPIANRNWIVYFSFSLFLCNILLPTNPCEKLQIDWNKLPSTIRCKPCSIIRQHFHCQSIPHSPYSKQSRRIRLFRLSYITNSMWTVFSGFDPRSSISHIPIRKYGKKEEPTNKWMNRLTKLNFNSKILF